MPIFTVPKKRQKRIDRKSVPSRTLTLLQSGQKQYWLVSKSISARVRGL